VALYGIVVFISVFYAADPSRAVNVIDDFTKDAAIAILITMLLQRGPALRQVTWALLLAGIFTGSITVYQFLTKTFDNNYWGFAEAPVLAILGSNEDYRSAGMLGSPNYYAQILVMLVPLALNQLWEEKSILLKLLAAWSALVCTLGIIFTYSRGGFFSLAAVVLAVLVYRRLNLIYTFLIVIATALILMLVPNPYLQRMQTIPDILLGRSSILEEASFRGRASEMIVALQMFADHPLIGVGVDNYPVYYQSYSRKLGLDSRTEERQAHDLYLRTAAETGLFGLFTFGLIVYVMIKSVVDAWRMLSEAGKKKYASLAVAYGISILGFMVDSIFTNLAFPRYFWILAGIAFALPTVAQNVINQKEEVAPQT
jgi:putative inorganic carbon (hco3(-)) transporter